MASISWFSAVLSNVIKEFSGLKGCEEKNAENLLIIRDKKLASLYTKNWHDHALHSEVYTGRGQ
jgi:hypothetical protein